MTLSDAENEDIERLVDAAFLKLFGKTYRREDAPNHTLDKIKEDFPELFGKQ